MKKLIIILSIFFTLSAFSVEIGKQVPSFSIRAADGKQVNIKDFRGKLVVLEWLNHGCPFIKKHYQSGNMQMIQKKYTEQDVIWLSVISSAKGKQGYSDADKAKEDKNKYGSFASHVLLDHDGKVGKNYGAKTTPHMYVVDRKGHLAYEGAIDSIASANKDDVKNATNYVAAALDLLLQNKDVKTAKTRPYGCSVKY